MYIDGCPNWKIADQRLSELVAERPDVSVNRRRVETAEEAERLGFRGSPSILVDGTDAFAAPDAPAGLACRVYATSEGLAGAPTLEQLRDVVARGAPCNEGKALGRAGRVTRSSTASVHG